MHINKEVYKGENQVSLDNNLVFNPPLKLNYSKEEKRRKVHALTIRHRGIIFERCIYWHRRLPVSVQRYYDLEDMVNEVIVYVIQQSYHYASQIARESTFVYHTTDNKCKTILGHYLTTKEIGCETVPLSVYIIQRHSVNQTQRVQESFNAVQRVIKFASDPLQMFLHHLFCGPCPKMPSPAVVEEFLSLSRSQRAGLIDYLCVLRYNRV